MVRLWQRWRRTAAPLLVALLCLASRVGAEERAGAERYRLRWVREGGAESCVSGAALERLLEEVLGERAPGRVDQAVWLEGVAKLAAPPLRFAIRVIVRDPASGEVLGERELTSADPKCSELTPALLLVLAMSVDPEAGRDGLPASVTEELQRGREEDVDVWPVAPSGTPAHVAPPPRKVEPLREPRSPLPKAIVTPRSSSSDPAVFGALASSSGILPELAVGVVFGGRIPLRRDWSLSLGLFGWWPQIVALPDSPFLEADGIQLAAAQASVALCGPLLALRLELALCGGVGAGLRWVSALALTRKENPTRAFFGPELGLEAQWRVNASWFLGAGTTGQARLRHDTFTYRDRFNQTHDWYEPPFASLRAWLALGALL